MAEQWRDIAGYDGAYQVSDLGQVRNTQTNKILQPIKMKNGRLSVTLSSDGFQRKCTVHSLVAGAFLGDCPAGHEIAQKDGDYTHNEARQTWSTLLAAKIKRVRDENWRVLGQSHETGTNRRRSALLPRGGVAEWSSQARHGRREREAGTTS